MKSESFIASRCAARVPPGRQTNPDEVQIGIRIEIKVAFRLGLELRIRHDPHFVSARKMPGEVPRKARFRATIRAAGMTDKQYFH
jgi:hypothetical protein